MALTKVFLAYDGSEESQKVLEWLLNCAQQMTILTVIVGVIELPYDLGIELEAEINFVRKNQKDRLKKVVLTFAEKGLLTTTTFLEGDPASQLIQYTAKERVDMIICGSRGVGGFESLLLGSVVHYSVTHSPGAGIGYKI